MSFQSIRNVAIIAHVDHGKTTLVDKMLKFCGSVDTRKQMPDRVMDKHALEQERGITILSKITGMDHSNVKINLVDTPGHADFGGEVERVLHMVDAVLLLVDAVEGPMPQTRFVTQKAFQRGLRPIVVINKVDRAGADPQRVIDQMFDLFITLDANNEQLEFPVLYASALEGWAVKDLKDEKKDIAPLLDFLIENVPPPEDSSSQPLRMQVATLDYSPYLGSLAIGRIERGKLAKGDQVVVCTPESAPVTTRVVGVFRALGLERVEVDGAEGGDIVAVAGLGEIQVSTTICAPSAVDPMPLLAVDAPTISLIMSVNDSPFAGREGKFVTTRQIRERLAQEAKTNVALRVNETEYAHQLEVQGRGELHLAILVETMRREGYEFALSRPQVVMKIEDGQKLEPFEELVIDVPANFHGAVMDDISRRKGELQDMVMDDHGRTRLTFHVPARGLMGFHHQFTLLTGGQGISAHSLLDYRPIRTGWSLRSRGQGAMISACAGESNAYALFQLQDRGSLIVAAQTKVYEGMIVGFSARPQDLVVNPVREKKLTNMRASGSDEKLILTPPLSLTLETGMEWIADDELLEITPQSIRLRKKWLKENERKRAPAGG